SPETTIRPTATLGAGLLGSALLGAALAEAPRALREPPADPSDEIAIGLPEGVRAVWDLAKAHRESTPTRERISVNGLWRFQPAGPKADEVPRGRWGYFKVPGAWPGITDYMQKDSQTVRAHPSWKASKLSEIAAAWYEREVEIPAAWSGRRIAIRGDYVNSLATVYVDGKRAGEIRFPGGELDLTSACRPGARHVLSLLVAALPLKGVLLSYADTNAAREVRGSVARRGLCGDVWLLSSPPGARLGDARVETSVRRWEIGFGVSLEGLAEGGRYSLRARVEDGGRAVREFASAAFSARDAPAGRFSFRAGWKPEKLWDAHTPENTYSARISLLDERGAVLDEAHPIRFGFREFWIEGRDFYLNGRRIFLSAVPFDNAQVSAAHASYAGARESLERLQSFGIDFVYTHNYDCRPGSHLGFEEILRAADDAGVLVALSQPHFSDYDWSAPGADRSNGYARHAEFYVRAAGSHPSVVFYSMSHNATGYNEDMNPDLMDGIQDRRDEWARRNAEKAARAEAIVRALDPTRIVYHHASGNLGPMHTSNFYPNFVPAQELSDWFERWASAGTKPFFACEYGAPFTWDWAMYRGWFRGVREFGSAAVPWDFSLAEWNSQFLGDAAFRVSEAERRNIRWEAARFRAGELWHRWDYPHAVGSRDFDERYPILAAYLAENWRAFRTWGVSGISPWEHDVFWKLRPGVERNRKTPLPTDWDSLQRPGFSPDYLEERYERMDLAYERDDWVATPAAEALYRNNLPLLAHIAGEPGRSTSRDHNFLPGEIVEKEIIAIDDARVPVACDLAWRLALPEPARGEASLRLETGEIARVPVRIALPRD
ncbi:MAG: glycoside hydrolase family 2 TIM barrel-domain containing protein, partial [Planctomycetota bacterium]